MDPSSRTDSRNAPLEALGGAPAPPEVVDGWRRLTRFPDGALREWWALLEPALTRPAVLQDGQRVGAFAARFALDHDDVALAVQASAFLVGRAAALDLAPDLLKEDLAKLSGRLGTIAEIVAAGYRERLRALRELAFEKSLLDHGNLLVGVEWRVDQVRASSHAVGLDTSLVFLTLKYRNGDDVARLTLQLTPAALDRLREFVGRFDG